MNANIPAMANKIRAESLKSSCRLSFAWCCRLISLLACFSFRVSWPILFLYEDHSLKSQTVNMFCWWYVPVLIYRGCGYPILASSIDARSCHDWFIGQPGAAKPVSQLSVILSQVSSQPMYKTKTGSPLEKNQSVRPAGRGGEGRVDSFYSKNMSIIKCINYSL